MKLKNNNKSNQIKSYANRRKIESALPFRPHVNSKPLNVCAGTKNTCNMIILIPQWVNEKGFLKQILPRRKCPRQIAIVKEKLWTNLSVKG